jgi:membrane associated rhomboid family serine protease
MSNIIEDTNDFLDRVMPPMIKKIILINVGICVLINVLSSIKPGFDTLVGTIFGQMPEKSWYMIWQHLTYMFIHFDPIHLFWNMFILFIFGRKLEEKLGGRQFLMYYLVAGAGAGAVHMLATHMFNTSYTNVSVIGASGAVFAIQLAYAAYWPNDIFQLIIPPIPLKAVHLITGLTILEVFMLAGPPDGISHITHLSGMLVGYVFLSRHHREWDIRRWR